MIPPSGSYSKKYQQQAKEELKQIREQNGHYGRKLENNQNVSKQTNALRRKLDQKIRAREEKEEERRKKILENRRLSQQLATEKFQRATEPNRSKHLRAASVGSLKDGEYTVGGYVIKIKNGVRVSTTVRHKVVDTENKPVTHQQMNYSPNVYLAEHTNAIMNNQSNTPQNDVKDTGKWQPPAYRRYNSATTAERSHAEPTSNNPPKFQRHNSETLATQTQPVDLVVKNQNTEQSSVASISTNSDLNTGSVGSMRSAMRSPTLSNSSFDSERKVTFSNNIHFNDGRTRPLSTPSERVPLYKRIPNYQIQEPVLTTEDLLDKFRSDALNVLSSAGNSYFTNGAETSETAPEYSTKNVATKTSEAVEYKNIAVVSPRLLTNDEASHNNAATALIYKDSLDVSIVTKSNIDVYNEPNGEKAEEVVKINENIAGVNNVIGGQSDIAATVNNFKVKTQPKPSSKEFTTPQSNDPMDPSQSKIPVNIKESKLNHPSSQNPILFTASTHTPRSDPKCVDSVKTQSTPSIATPINNPSTPISKLSTFSTVTSETQPAFNTTAHAFNETTHTFNDNNKKSVTSLGVDYQSGSKNDNPKSQVQASNTQNSTPLGTDLQNKITNVYQQIPTSTNYKDYFYRSLSTEGVSNNKSAKLESNLEQNSRNPSKQNTEASTTDGTFYNSYLKQYQGSETEVKDSLNYTDEVFAKVQQSLAGLTFENIRKSIQVPNPVPTRVQPAENREADSSDDMKDKMVPPPAVRRNRVIVSADAKKRVKADFVPRPPEKPRRKENKKAKKTLENTTEKPPNLTKNSSAHYRTSSVNPENNFNFQSKYMHEKMQFNTPYYNDNFEGSNLPADSLNVPWYREQSLEKNLRGQLRKAEGNKPRQIQLDKTPTDDEINQLWQNVRECLSTDPEQTHSEIIPINRTPKHFQRTYSGSLMNRSGSLIHQQQQHTSPRTNPLNPPGISSGPPTPSGLAKRHSLLPHRASKVFQNAGMISSKLEPLPQQTDKYSSEKQVTSSMASFLTMEEMCNQPAFQTSQQPPYLGVQPSAQPTFKPSKRSLKPTNQASPSMTALSIAEQNVMASLERINKRLEDHERRTGLHG